MHDTQVANERLETAFGTGNVIELAPSAHTSTHRNGQASSRDRSNDGEFPMQTPDVTAIARPNTEPIPFEQVQDKVQSDDKEKWDVVLPRSEVLMREGKLLFPDARFYECEDGIVPSPWAVGQICQRLNIPTSYFRRCPSHLQDVQFNWWNAKPRNRGRDQVAIAEPSGHAHEYGHTPFDAYAFNENPFGDEETNGDSYASTESASTESFDTGEPSAYQNGFSKGSGNGHKFRNGIYAGTEKSEYWLLRSKGEVLRAVLTDKYTPLDNCTLLDSLHRCLPAHLQVQWLSLDNESFHLRIIDPRMTKEILRDDPLMAGLHIANSEVGKRSLSVDVMVWRQVCSNGLIKLVRGKNLLCQRHVSVSPHHFTALLKQALSSAVSHANDFMEQMAWSTQEPIKDVESEMKSLMQHYHLSQNFTDQVKAALQNERSDQQSTVFGLTNALTAAAQTLDAEQRYDVEVLAGKWLEGKSLKSSLPRRSIVNVPLAVSVPVEISPAKASQTGSATSQDVQEAVEAAEVLFEAQAVPYEEQAVPAPQAEAMSDE